MPPDGRRSSSGNRHRGSSNSSSRQGSSGGGSSSRSRPKSSSRRRDNESNHRRGRRASAGGGGGGFHHHYGNYGQHHHNHLHENESIVGSLAPSVANTENTESTTQISNTKISKFQASLEAKAKAKKKQDFAAMRSTSVALSSQSRAKSRVNDELKDVGTGGGSSNSSAARSSLSQSRSKSQSSLVQKQPTHVPTSPSAAQRRDVHVNYTTGGGGGGDDDKADHRDDRPHNLENGVGGGVGVGGVSMTQTVALETMGASGGGARFQMMDITVTVLGLSGILAEKRAPKESKVQSLVSKIKDRTMGSPRSVMSSNNDASQSSSQHNHNDSSRHRRSNSHINTNASVVTPVDDDDDVSEEDLGVARPRTHPTFALASFTRNALKSDTTISTHIPSLALTRPVRTYDTDNGDSIARYTGVWPAKNVNVSMDDIDRSSVAFSRVLQRDRRGDGRRRASGDADDSISSRSGSGSGSASRDVSSSTSSSRRLKANNHDDRFVPELINMKVGLISGGEMITLGQTTLVVSGVVKSVEFNLPLTVHDPKTKQTGRRRRGGGGGAGKDEDRNTDLAESRFAPGAALRRRARYLQDLALFHVSKDQRNGSFAWDPSVRYRIDDNATLRVMLTVVPHNTANVELMTLKSLSMNPSMSMAECVADIDASSPASDGDTNANSRADRDGDEEATLDRLGMNLSAIEIGTDNVAAVWKTAPRDTLFNIVGYEPPSPGEEEEMRRESEEKRRREVSDTDRRGPSGDDSRDRRRPSELLKGRSQINKNNNNDGIAKSDIVTEIVHDVSTPREDPPPSTNDKHEDRDGDRDRRKADRAARKSREPSVATSGSKKKKSRIGGGWANCFSFGNTDSVDDAEITDEMIREFEKEERRRRNGKETTSDLLSNVMCHAGAPGEDDDDTAAESYRGYDCDAGTVETEDLYDDDDTNDDRRQREGRGGGASRRDRDDGDSYARTKDGDGDDDDDDGSYTTYNDEETAFTYGTDGDGTYRTYDSQFVSVESDNHSGSYIVSSNDSLSRRSRASSSKVDIRTVRKARETLRRFANRIGVDPEDLI